MNKRRREGERRAVDAPSASPFESGVIAKGLADHEAGDPQTPAGHVDREPPWDVVHAYLARGEHRDWVEGWAARSPAFRDVLEALRNDHEERTPPRRRNVVPLDRSR